VRRTWKPQAVEGLPDRLILFDGNCLFCSNWVRFVIARDPGARFRFVTIQEEFGKDLARRLGIDLDDPETNAVVFAGYARFKSDAALVVLGHLKHWSWARALRWLPRFVRDGVYDLIARNRYRMFGRSRTCLMPTPEIRRHFWAHGAPSD
jgi:predicted DCC family thiol-disulfide oxidoreductase YuxK